MHASTHLPTHTHAHTHARTHTHTPACMLIDIKQNSQQDFEVLQACKDRLVLMQQGYFTYVSQADHQKLAKNVYAMHRYQHLFKLNNHE